MKLMIIDGNHQSETRVAICKNSEVVYYDYDTLSKELTKGNISLATVIKVERSLQAVFVQYCNGKQGFLPFSEIHPCYYNIPEELSANNPSPNSYDSYDDLKLKQMLENKVLISPNLTPDDEKLPEIQPEIKNYSTVVDKPAPEIFDVIPSSIDNIEVQQVDKNIIAATAEEIVEFEELELPTEALNESSIMKKYSVDEVIRKNQVMIVQVIKEERGNKGASLTTYLSLAGRYCVLMPNSLRQGGISRRISKFEDRKRIKDIIDNLGLPEGVGVIIRTAGADRSKAEIKRDYDYLVKTWNTIRSKALSLKAPAFLHAEGDVIKRCLRDACDNDISEIIVQGEQSYKQAKEFMKMIMPHQIDKLKPFKSKVPIFVKFKIDGQINGMYDQVVGLPSGGYLVIGHTEALIAIDVNSGKLTTESNIEDTAIKTNIEAAVEIAHQIRLRDLSGLIVVDFIDMADSNNRSLVERKLRDALLEDKAKIQLSRISPLGLLEISRQRLRPNYLESNTTQCSHCNGTGRVKTSPAMAIDILRAIESEIYRNDCEEVKVYTNPEHIAYILNNFRKDLSMIEHKYQVELVFINEYMMNIDQYSIEKIRKFVPLKKNYYGDNLESEYSANNNDHVIMDKKRAQWKWNQKKEHRQELADTITSVEEGENKYGNVEVIEQPIKATREGAYRNSRKKFKYNKKKRNKQGNNEESNDLRKNSLFDDRQVEKEFAGLKDHKNQGESSLLKELWKKIID